MPHPDWNAQYVSRDALPWDTGTPDRNLTELWARGQRKTGKALEVGCGTGTNALWLAQQGCEVLGVDVSPAAIERARHRAGTLCRFAVADFLQSGVAGGPFDFVFDRGCFHVFDGQEERATFARQVARVLAPGGQWLSLIGSTEEGRREGPPQRSARDVTDAIEPALRILELRATSFETIGYGEPAAWLCLSARRDAPAQPSTIR